MGNFLEDSLEFKMMVYDNNEWESYIRRMRNLGEREDDLNIELPPSSVEPPRSHLGRIRISPYKINHYVEAFSLNSITENPNNPLRDNVQVTLNSGESFALEIGYDEFEARLKKFFKKPNRTVKRRSTDADV